MAYITASANWNIAITTKMMIKSFLLPPEDYPLAMIMAMMAPTMVRMAAMITNVACPSTTFSHAAVVLFPYSAASPATEWQKSYR